MVLIHLCLLRVCRRLGGNFSFGVVSYGLKAPGVELVEAECC